MTTRGQTGGIVFLLLLVVLQCQAQIASNIIKVPDEGFRVNNMSKLVFYRHAQTWTTAKHICRQQGGDLFSPSSSYIIDIIRSYAANDSVWKSVWDNTWTALYQQINGVYAWSDRYCRHVGATTFWKGPSELDPSSKRCFFLNKDHFVWEREDCKTEKKFICDIKNGLCDLSYQRSPFRVADTDNVTSVTEMCLKDCQTMEDCFMATFSDVNSTCHYYLAGGTETKLAEKLCFQASINESNTDSMRPNNYDQLQPSICTLDPPVAPSSSSLMSSSSSLQPSTSSFWDASSPSVSPSAECPASTVVSTVYETAYVTAMVTTTEVQAITNVVHSTVVLTTTLTTTTVVTATSVVPCLNSTVTVTPSPVFETVTVTASPTQSCDVSTQIVPTTVTVSSVSMVTSCQVTVTPECDVSPMTSSSAASVTSTPTFLYPSSSSISELQNPPVKDGYPDVSLVCANISVGNISLESVLAALRSELTINRKNTSMALRKFTSAPDPRVSSKTIGFSAILLCVIPLILVFAVDTPVLYRDVKNTVKRLLSYLGYEGKGVGDNNHEMTERLS